METKRLILVMVVFMALILAWPRFIDMIARTGGYTLPTTQPTNASAPIAETGTVPTTATVMQPTATTGPTIQSTAEPVATTGPTTGVASSTTSGWTIATAAPIGPASTQAIGSDQYQNTDYAIQLVASEHGAGLEKVVLNDFYQTLRNPKQPFAFEEPGSFVEQTRPFAIRGVIIDGDTVDLTGARWSLTTADRSDASGIQRLVYELSLAHNGSPALTLRRAYTVMPRKTASLSINGVSYSPLGFEVGIGNAFVNLTDRPLRVALRYNAPTVPPTEAERYSDGGYLTGWWKDRKLEPTQELTDSIRDPRNLLDKAVGRVPYWFGTTTTYFMALHRFEPAGGAQAPIDWFDSINAHTLTPESSGLLRQNEVVIITKPAEVAAKAEATIASDCYFGPRKREILTSPFYSLSWVQFDGALVITSGICGYCTWQWLINILFWLLTMFHAATKDWGLAIIGLVFLVRLLLHPISRKAQMSMLKFGKLAPEMDRIKKKYADDQESMNREMMKFYREHGGTQLMGCLPMFLQMPVWIALWQAMNTTFDLRHQPFFYGFTWIHDLSKPDHLFDFAAHGIAPFKLPLLSFIVISGFNVLPIVYGIVQFVQFKIQPKPPTMTPEQAQQQKMTQWMMLFMMPLMLYASPSGLMIYMITSFTIGIVESKLIKKKFAEMSANDARFTVVDDNSPAAVGAQKAVVRRAQAEVPKKKGLFAIIEEARARAGEMQRDIEKNRKKK